MQAFFQTYPDGIANVRLLINSNLTKSDENKEVLKKFDQMLRSYHDAFSKSYSDHSYNFDAFLNGELKTLISVLIKNNYIKDVLLSKKLRELLK
jgi:hypothetical protein